MYNNFNSKYESILRIILILILEIILPFKILIYLINNENITTLSNIENSSVIIFIIFWVFISYLRGRYSRIKKETHLKNIS